MIIKNSQELAINPLRKDALRLIEASLSAIDSEAVLKRNISLQGGILNVSGRDYDLDTYSNIFIVGFGKASCQAAQYLETVLGNYVKAGAVIGLSHVVCQVVDIYEGTHPLPSHQNYTASKHIEEIAHQAGENDLVIAIISGGGSALLCSSMAECDQGKSLYTSFLETGGTIEELNIVRKHISRLKGGGLAAALYPATVIGLIFSDVPGGDMSAVASGPTYFDNTTAADAQAIVEKYGLPKLKLNETPKDEEFFKKINNVTVVSNEVALEALKQESEKMGYKPVLLGSTIYNTPEETVALFLENNEPGTCVFFGGETKLTIPFGCVGKGGRNDALALSVLEHITENRLFASIATDGHDNTDAAGAIVDQQVKSEAIKENLKLTDYTECHNSYPFFQKTGGHIETGKLDSNVSDIVFWLNAAEAPESEKDIINAVHAVVVKDSRGKDTITVTVETVGGVGSFSVPSGASTGVKEVVALPALQSLEKLSRLVAPALIGMSVLDQEKIDAKLHELDGTKTFANIGGNTALGVSAAALRAAAKVKDIELWQYIAEIFKEAPQAAAPHLFVNMINGGSHAPYGSCIQEHQVIPETEDLAEALGAVQAIWSELTKIIEAKYTDLERSIGDEGGYALKVEDEYESFELIEEAIKAADLKINVSLGTDIAASSFYDGKEAIYKVSAHRHTSESLHNWHQDLQRKFPSLIYVEDPYDESVGKDFAHYLKAHKGVTVIGDDLTTTNEKVLAEMIKEKAVNGIIIKPNQIGTISDTLATMRLAYRKGVRCVVSHRSGETMDSFIADLAFGTKSFGLKAGAPTMRERGAKYRRLLSIAGYAESPMQIVATVGPASSSPEVIAEMIDAGLDVVRLNLSWGTHAEHREYIKTVRETAASLGSYVQILQDLSGPRVQKGSEHTFTSADPVFTAKDRSDIDALLDLEPEYIAQSFVASAADIFELRKYLDEKGSRSKIIAKIERPEALENLYEIIDVVDAIMVARGDLGDAIPYETLPFVKQEIIDACREAGKPSIVATEMLTSMQDDPKPNRADISDIADAVVDGASATMLSNETAVGANPAEAVGVMRKVVDEAYWRVAKPPVDWL